MHLSFYQYNVLPYQEAEYAYTEVRLHQSSPDDELFYLPQKLNGCAPQRQCFCHYLVLGGDNASSNR